MKHLVVIFLSICLCACSERDNTANPSWLIGQWKYESLTPPALETWSAGPQDTLIGNGSVIVGNDTI